MTLSVGDKIGHYEVIALLGQGGMGEVYRARDTTLKRDVALKVLPATFLRDPERMARFQREAEVLASLDHPNVGHIYGIADSADSRGLVLALIEGPTLADRIAAGPIPLDEALAIAKQIIEALEYAHDRGVVHRDLKPANVKITPEGVVKVLDFGLAKVLEDEPPPSSLANSPTLTLGHTRTGVILGTAAYMSPEQAVGRPVDRRSDIFSFGSVLYEMLTGKPAFTGATTPDVLEAVARNDPDWSALPPGTPRYLRRLLERMLTKDRKQRLQAIGEARIALEKMDGTAEVPLQAEGRSASKLTWAMALAALVFASAAAALAFLHFHETAPVVPPPVQFQIETPEKPAVTALLQISPDGRQMVFGGVASDGHERLWLRSLDSLDPRVLPGTDGPQNPFWSADSRFVVFGAEGKLKKVPIAGGPPQIICDLPDNNSRGGSWNRDGVIILGSQAAGISRVPASGGQRTEVTVVDRSRQETFHGRPVFLPDGKHFLYLRASSSEETSGIYVGSLDVKPEQQSRERLLPGHLGIGYMPSSNPAFGYVLFLQDETLLAQSFDNRRLQLTGEPVPITEQVGSNGNTVNYFSVAENGTLIYRKVTASTSRLTWFDRQGKALGTLGEPADYRELSLSPDGTRIAVARRDASNLDVWVVDSARGTSTRLTFNPGADVTPVWSSGGDEIFFSSLQKGIFGLYRKSASGTGQDMSVLRAGENLVSPTDVTFDGKNLLYTANQGGIHIFVLPLTGDSKGALFMPAVEQGNHAKFSPDGRWVVYQSNESGRGEIYVRPFPSNAGGGGKWAISNAGGSEPRWRRDGKEILYLGMNGMVTAVDVTTNGAFKVGAPRALFPAPRLGGASISRGWHWDVTPDGQRFLFNAAAETEDTNLSAINLVLNWPGLPKR
ncbi:MAG TPA: protein kinase [Bryobacteraceae bacterium]|nr:protein kinase [Bryobacteraceae bacterium]